MHNHNDIMQLRHSAAHLLAHALTELYPDTQLTIGPATETGFFYDILPVHNIKEEDLEKITERMLAIVHQNLPLTHEQMTKKDAEKLYKNNQFKIELIQGIEGDTVGIARQGTFYDLCRGGHVTSTAQLKHFKLTGISGSYWRADKNNPALQRISGIIFFTQDELNAYEQKREELLKYDHRKIGKQLDFFSFHDEGVGFPFFHPKGKTVLNLLVSYMRSVLKKARYCEIETPTMLSDELWQRSGHYKFYSDKMYFSTIDEKNYAIKPMNCPGSILIYKERPRSYRELPLRLNEFGKVHRHELSGVLHGLFRVRSFTIDDTHIYCTVDQVEQEIVTNMNIIMHTLKKFGFDKVTIGLSTKPTTAMGDDILWEKAINGLKNALNHCNLTYKIQEGEGAFYGPKIEIVIEDSMGREWQCGTIQIDFFQPENFDLSYVSPQGTYERPVIVHQAMYGSLERFFGILLEHHKGNLPFWLSPVQMRILTIREDQQLYAQKIETHLIQENFRVERNESSDSISNQIKNAQLQKVPWMLIIGAKEVETNTITIRYLDGSQEFGITLENLIKKAHTLS